MGQYKKILPYLKVGAICLLVFYCFRSVTGQLARVRELVNSDGPFFLEWEKRFEPIKEILPFEYGVVGYVGDWDVPGLNYDPANTEAEHILTQYTLTPIVVSRDTSHEWILVNLSEKDFDTWLKVQEGEFEVTKFKYSLYLLRRIQ
jgi:hypothetical protein